MHRMDFGAQAGLPDLAERSEADCSLSGGEEVRVVCAQGRLLHL